MVGSGEWVRGVLVAAALLAVSGGAARADDAAPPPSADLADDIVQMFSWIDDRLTEVIRAGQPDAEPTAKAAPEAEPAPAPAPVPEPVAQPAPQPAAPPAVPVAASQPETPETAAPEGEGNPLLDLVNWLDTQLEAGAEASRSADAPVVTPPPSTAAAPPSAQPAPVAAAQPQAAPTPVPAEPVVTAEPLDLTGSAQGPANAGGRGGLLVR